MKAWLDGWDRSWTRSGGSYTGGEWCVVLHTTEGYSIEGALAAYSKSGAYPHFTICLETRRKFQHVALTASATAMRNESGGVQTNRQHAVQIEIVGFAGESHTWLMDDLQWLGGILAEIKAAGVPFELVAPKFVGTESGTIATTTAKQRFTHDQWLAFNGVCGHQHVPENHHWDPGRLNIAAVLAAAAGEDDVTPEQLKQAIREVLNEGTAFGFLGWAQTNHGIVELLRAHDHYLKQVLAAIDEIEPAAADAPAAAVVKQAVKDALKEIVDDD